MDLKNFIMSSLDKLPKGELVEALAAHILRSDSLREEWRETQKKAEVTEAVNEAQEKTSTDELKEFAYKGGALG